MDRQQLNSLNKPLQELDKQQFSLAHVNEPLSVHESFTKAGGLHTNRLADLKENSFPTDAPSAGKSEYVKERQPVRGILRKAEGPGLDTLQSKFSSLQDEVTTFSSQSAKRRDSLIGRGGLPPALQHPLQHVVAQAPSAGVSGSRPVDEPAALRRSAQLGGPAVPAPQLFPSVPVPSIHAPDSGASADDDVGLGPPSSKDLVKMPVGNLANSQVVKAAQDVFEEAAFKQLCTEGLTKQLQRTKDGATDKSRIQELAELVKLLRKCLKDMGSRATGYIDKCAGIEQDYVQQVESINLASQTSVRKAEAELAAVRSTLAATERDLRNERAKLCSDIDTRIAEISRLLRDVERLTDERDRARDDAARAEQQRQQLELEFKELRRTASQQQRDLSVTQGEVVRALTEDKITLEGKLHSIREDFSRQSLELDAVKECVVTYEHEVHQLTINLNSISGTLAERDSRLAQSRERIAELETAAVKAHQQLAAVAADAERLKQALERSNTECRTLEAFVEDQAAKLDTLQGHLTGLEQERSTWEDERRRLEASLSVASNERSALATEVMEIKAELDAVIKLKDDVDQTARNLAMEKSTVLRELTNLQHQLEFAEGRTTRAEQEAAGLRTQLEALHADLTASRRVVEEKNTRLEQLEGEFAALKEVLGGSNKTTGESGQEIVAKLVSKIASLQQAAIAAEAVRRQLHNELVDIRGNIRVYCRVKPHPTPTTRQGPDGTSIILAVDNRDHTFTYDRVFGPDSTQEQVFSAVSELVQSALDGFHVCIFSYGQTGAGKTHTMQGGESSASRGIIPRSLEKILATARKLEEEAEWRYVMKAAFIEVYNQGLRDLLSKGAEITDNNAIKHDANGGHTIVQGADLVSVTDLDGALELVRKASEARKVVATAMNSASSRSHCVFMLNIEGRHANSGTRLLGSLCLVDLAGSERLDRSLVEGAAKKEACAINSSLSSLGDVFAALSSKSSHVPYRNSKLTYLLQPCLGGNGKTLMFVNINPEPASAGESLCSLRFAAKVNGCETGAKGGARRNVQTFGGGGGGSSELEHGDPAGMVRFSMGSIPRPSGMEAASAPAPRRASTLPSRPGAEAWGTRARVGAVGRSTAGIVGSSAGAKRPGPQIANNAAKRSRP